MALGLVGVFGLAAAAAADSGIYLGGGVGLYNVKIDGGGSYVPPESVGNTAAASLGSGGDFEDSASVWRVFAGYQFKLSDSKWIPSIGLQADYIWYGQAQDSVPPSGTNGCKSAPTACTYYDLTGDAWELSVRPSWAITSWLDVFGRVGYQWYNVDVKPRGVKGQSDSNNELMYAGGLGFHFTPAFGATAEYEVVDVSSGDLNAVTVNFVYTIPR
jgi:opacity protein-like surface antigen